MKRQVTHVVQSGGHARLAQYCCFVSIFQDVAMRSRDEKLHGVQTCGLSGGKASRLAVAHGCVSELRAQLVFISTNGSRAIGLKHGKMLLVKDVLIKVNVKNQTTNIKKSKHEQAMQTPYTKRQPCPHY
jgi:hypothetical protein